MLIKRQRKAAKQLKTIILQCEENNCTDTQQDVISFYRGKLKEAMCASQYARDICYESTFLLKYTKKNTLPKI